MSSAVSTAPADSLVMRLERTPSDSAIAEAIERLGAVASPELLTALVKAMVRAGVAGMALRLVESLRDGRLTAMADVLRTLPTGEIQQSPIGHTCGFAAGTPRPSVAYRSAEGNTFLFWDTPASFRPVLPIRDGRAIAARTAWPRIAIGASFGVFGVPDPAVWDALVKLEGPAGYKPAIDVFEPDPDVLGAWLRVVETSATADGRVQFHGGPQLMDDFARLLEQQPERMPPTLQLVSDRPGLLVPAIDHPAVKAVLRARANRQRQRFDVQVRREADRDAAFWAARYAAALRGEQPLRVVGFTTRHSTVMRHAMRDLARAFERRGHRFDVVMERSAWSGHVDVATTLAENDCDLIVVINHLRSELADAVSTRIPFLCWMQDHMTGLCSAQAGRSIGPFDLVAGHSPGVMSALYGYPLERFIGTNNLTDAETYSAEPLPPDNLQPFLSDITYVGHGGKPVAELIDEIGGASTAIRRVLESFVTRAQGRLQSHGWIAGMEIGSMLLEAEREVGIAEIAPGLRRSHVFPAAMQLYDRLFRHQTIEWAARWAEDQGRTLRLFGSGWDRHPRFSRYACGTVENGRPLRAVYQAARINLQANGYGSLHQRLLDAVACGGFVLTRENPNDFVRPPFLTIRDAIVRGSARTVEELIAFAERDPQLRRAISEAEGLAACVIAPLSDPRRAAFVELQKQVNDMPMEKLTDEGLLSMLLSMEQIPHRTAADIAGFAETTFGGEAAFRDLLDRFIDDGAARAAAAAPMRADVLRHDTFDGLVVRVLETFGELFAKQKGAS